MAATSRRTSHPQPAIYERRPIFQMQPVACDLWPNGSTARGIFLARGWLHWREETHVRMERNIFLTPHPMTYYCLRRRQWHPTPVLLPGESHGPRSLVGCSPWGHRESDTTERLHFHFSLLCIGEGNGSPLQCSCLENPRDGVAQSRTRLKRLSSSSSQT